MARIELRHTTIRLVDGHSNTAAVDEATPAVDDTDVGIDTLGTPGVIPVSSRFTVIGSNDVYTVTASDANGILQYDLGASTGGNYTLTVDGNTTASILFDATIPQILAAVVLLPNVTTGDFGLTGAGTVGDPYLLKASASGAFANIAVALSATDVDLSGGSGLTELQTQAGGETYNVTFTPAFKTNNVPVDDAVMTFTGRTLEVKVGDGNATYTENREFNYDLDRGNLDTVREGDQQPIDWTLDLTWEFITSIAGAATPTVEEAFKQTGPASVWQSSSVDPCEPYAVDIEIENNPNCDTDQIETTTIPDARYESLEHDIDAATISSAGRANSTGAISARRAKVV